MTTIHDHSLPPLEPDLVGWEPVVGAIRKQIAQRREELNMQQSVLDFTAARADRDAGMSRAHDAAARRDEDWPDAAYGFLVRYARTHEQFISEELTAMADRMGYSSPADPRAWGAIFQRAARNNIIQRIGYGVSQRRHLSPTPLWRSLVFGGSAA
ncbi:hypothetical protein FHW84_001801 [Dyella sp. SG562]|uniref:hypothetical protein n=1 Tax=Dyella sp. SG562 TaxID=2587017 RepID=UPI0014222989|nr:hypothetical protein [Dyella sp. SG562]NII73232.1 hypothetical protein [Dyella sp. SG562]